MGQVKKAAVKVEEDKKLPDFVARARQAPGSDFYLTIGAAWKKENGNGEEFVSVKLNNLPVGFDGSFLLMKPLPPKE